MKRFSILLVVLALASSRAQPPPEDRLLAVRAARLLDGLGDSPLEPAVVLLRGERIQAVGKHLEIPPNARVIDLGSATILPGLIDLHTHLTSDFEYTWEEVLTKTTPSRAAIAAVRNAHDTLRAGFTTCRDMGPTWPYTDIDLRDAIDKGIVPGPRLQVAGNYVSATGGAGDARQFSIYLDIPIVRNLADGVDEVRKAVRTNFKYRADFIKILATGAVLSKGIPPGAQQYSEDELRVAVEEAARWGRFVAAHAHGTEGIKAALRAGVRTVDHGSMLDDEAISMLRARTAWYVPTLYVGEAVVQEGKSLGIPESEIERSRQMMAFRTGSFRKALAAGLEIPFSTDAGVFPHGRNAREFESRVREGETPMHAIQSATSVAAKVLGWSDRVGSLTSGKFADMIAVERDPAADIRELQNVKWVMKGGLVIYDELKRK